MDPYWLTTIELGNYSSLTANDDFLLKSNGGFYNAGLYLWGASTAEFNGKTDIIIENGVDTARGVYVYDGWDGSTRVDFRDDLRVSLAGSNADYIFGLDAREGGKIEVHKGLIMNDNPDIMWSMYARGNDSQIRVNTSGTGLVQVAGDVGAIEGASLYMNLNQNNSYFTGASYTATSNSASDGTVDFDITNRAIWNMTGNSSVTNLTMDQGNVDFIATDAAGDAEYATLKVANLSGNGTFFMRADIPNSDNTPAVNISDKLIVTGTSSGNHQIFVSDQSTGSAAGDEIVRVAEIADGNAQFTLSNVNGYVDMGAYQYRLTEVDPALGPAEKHWYLTAGRAPVGPGPLPVIPPPALTQTADHSVNILNINYLLSNVENQTLLQRMGELRQSEGSDGDVWARVFTGKLNSFTDDVTQGFDLDYTGIQIGADKRFVREHGDLYLGGMIGTTKADANYDIGDGDTKSYHAGMYLTYKDNNGFYIDGIAKYVHMKNNFTAQTGGGYTVKGDGNSSGYSVGIEVGKRFYFNHPQTGWYVEPQGQLTYSHQGGSSVKATNGLKTDLESYDSTIGRVSAIIGYALVEGDNPIDVYLKTGYMKEFDGKAGYVFNDSKATYATYKLNGDWWDNGIGVNARINKNHNMYMDLNYSVGDKFDKVQVNAGYRYSF